MFCLFLLVEHIGKTDDKDRFHEFRRLKTDSEETDPASRAARGHSDDEDKDNEENSRSVEPFCLIRDDPVIIIDDDKNKDDTDYKGGKLFYNEVVRAAVKRACGADEIDDADGEKDKAVI